jgi:hypothetical protein
MRTRDKNYSDYGITDDEAKRIKEYCQTASVEDKLTLFQCAISSAPGLEVEIYESLVSNIGYDKLSKRKNIPIKRDDFYGYQRKTLDEYRRLMTLFGFIIGNAIITIVLVPGPHSPPSYTLTLSLTERRVRGLDCA